MLTFTPIPGISASYRVDRAGVRIGSILMDEEREAVFWPLAAPPALSANDLHQIAAFLDLNDNDRQQLWRPR